MKLQTQAGPTNNANEAEWRCKIDYVTLSSAKLHVPIYPDVPIDPTADLEATTSLQSLGVLAAELYDVRRWRRGAGRSGHARSAYHDIGVTIFYAHPFNKPIVEFGGAACDLLHANGELLPLVQREYEDLTRLDLAADLVCDTAPSSFVAHGFSARYASDGHDRSATGETQYIGSPKSDRSAKVYRYAPPHPRSHALRVEVTLRRELAKAAGQELCCRSVSHVFSMAAQPFQFKSPQWRLPTSDRLTLATLRSEPTNASRLRWLATKIRPAVIRAHQAGLIDLSIWLAEADNA